MELLRWLQSQPSPCEPLKGVDLVCNLGGSVIELVDSRLDKRRGVFWIALGRVNRP
jgi:hypothetical protein